MSKKKYAVKMFENKNIYTVLVILLSAFMLIIPFYRGLFFRTEYMPAIAFISIIFSAYMFFNLKDRTNGLITYMDVSVLLIPAAYFISFFFAVNAKDALDMLLVYCSYFMLYKLVTELSVKDEKYKNVLINVIIASAFILSFTSMLHLAGIIDIKGASIGKRLYGLYQYANTTASVLGVGIILTLNKFVNENNIKAKFVYQAILTALIPAFIFTLSRGGYLVLAGVLLLNFLLIKAREKIKLLLGLFVSLLSSAFSIYKYYILPENAFSTVWIYYLISIIISAIIIYIINFFRNRIKIKFTERSINIALIAMAVIFTGAVAFLFSVKEPIEYRIEHTAAEEKSWKYKAINLYELESNSKYTLEFDVRASLESQYSYGIVVRSYNKNNEKTDLISYFEATGSKFAQKSFDFTTLEDTDRILILLYNYETDSYTLYKNIVIKDSNGELVKKMDKLKYVPEAIASRLADISWETKNVSLRVHFVKDGLKIIRDYPLAGAGGGAWKNLYRQYQSIPYDTTEVHNYYVQYGTEVGIIGIMILVGLIIMLVMSMIKAIKSSSEYLYVYIAAILLFLHSMIDFNLSLIAVGYILWMLIGIINSDKNTPLIERYPHRYTTAAALVLALAVCFSSSAMRYGMKLGTQAAISSKAGMDVNKTIGLYEKAASLDKYNAIYRIDLAQILNKQLRETRDKKYYDGVMEQISLIRKYEPYNHQYTSTICNIYLSLGKFEEASKLADVRVIDEPLLAQSYAIKIDANFEIVEYYARSNTVQEAVPYLEKIVEAKEQLEKVNSRLQEPLVLNEKNLEKVEVAYKALEMIKTE